jgi:hypothetical protein
VGAAEKSKEKSSFCGAGGGAVGVEREDEGVCKLERRVCVFPVEAIRGTGEVMVTGGATNGAVVLEVDVRRGEAGVGAGVDDEDSRAAFGCSMILITCRIYHSPLRYPVLR